MLIQERRAYLICCFDFSICFLKVPRSYVTKNIFQGAITKRMTAIEEMAGMDVLCSDKTGTLTLNRLTVDRSLIEVLALLHHKFHILFSVFKSQCNCRSLVDFMVLVHCLMRKIRKLTGICKSCLYRCLK